MDYELPLVEWADAIMTRRSRRRFSGRELPDDMATRLDRLCKLLSNSRVRLVPVPGSPDEVFRGVIGQLGRVRQAPVCIALAGDSRDPAMQESVGYLGQCLVLEATVIGLATCWVAGFFHHHLVADRIQLQPWEQIPVVIAVGFAADYTLTERVMSRTLRSHRRKRLASMCRGLAPDFWPDWVRSGLSAARLAPSAVNRQPWRFDVDYDSITVSTAGGLDVTGVSQRLDCGIAMLHLELGALKGGVRGQWESLRAPRVARFYVDNGDSNAARAGVNMVPGEGRKTTVGEEVMGEPDPAGGERRT